MNKGTKISKTKQANRAFEEWNSTRYPISKENGQGLFYAESDEIFVRCTNFQKKWYVSNKGNVISFSNPNKPVLLKSETNKRGRERYRRTDKKTIQIAQLIAESFGVYRFGENVKDLQVHHIRKYDMSMGRAYNNNPELLQYVSEQAHSLLTYLQNHPRKKRTPEQEQHILELLSKITETENPNKATIVIDNEEKETAIYSEEQETVIDRLKDSSAWPIINNVAMLSLIESRFNWCLDTINKHECFEKLTFFSLTVDGQRRYYRVKDGIPKNVSWKDFRYTDTIGHFIVIDDKGTILYKE